GGGGVPGGTAGGCPGSDGGGPMTERAGGGPADGGGASGGQAGGRPAGGLGARGGRDRRGALNFITPDVVAAACRDVRLGRSVSLAAPIEDRAGPDNPQPASHRMNTGQDVSPAAAGLAFATDRFAMNVHGDADSHLDALCHV